MEQVEEEDVRLDIHSFNIPVPPNRDLIYAFFYIMILHTWIPAVLEYFSCAALAYFTYGLTNQKIEVWNWPLSLGMDVIITSFVLPFLTWIICGMVARRDMHSFIQVPELPRPTRLLDVSNTTTLLLQCEEITETSEVNCCQTCCTRCCADEEEGIPLIHGNSGRNEMIVIVDDELQNKEETTNHVEDTESHISLGVIDMDANKKRKKPKISNKEQRNSIVLFTDGSRGYTTHDKSGYYDVIEKKRRILIKRFFRKISRTLQRALAVSLVICMSTSFVTCLLMSLLAGGTWSLKGACTFKAIYSSALGSIIGPFVAFVALTTPTVERWKAAQRTQDKQRAAMLKSKKKKKEVSESEI